MAGFSNNNRVLWEEQGDQGRVVVQGLGRLQDPPARSNRTASSSRSRAVALVVLAVVAAALSAAAAGAGLVVVVGLRDGATTLSSSSSSRCRLLLPLLPQDLHARWVLVQQRPLPPSSSHTVAAALAVAGCGLLAALLALLLLHCAQLPAPTSAAGAAPANSSSSCRVLFRAGSEAGRVHR